MPRPLEGVTVVAIEQAVAAPFATPPARGPRRARRQDRAAGRRRLRARVRHHGARPLELLRVAEPVERVADAGSEAARGGRRRRPPARARRRVRGEPRARRGRPAGTCPGRAPRAPSSTRRVPRDRIRVDRPVREQEGLRPARAERGRPGLAHGHRGSSGQVGISVADIAAGMYAFCGHPGRAPRPRDERHGRRRSRCRSSTRSPSG